MTETAGQNIDARIALVEAKVKAIETAASTDWVKVKAWVKTNWPHFVTYAGLAAVAFKDALVKLI